MRIDFIKGYFDVREYNAKKQRAERTIKGNDTTITFDVIFNAADLPAELARYAKSYEKEGVTKYVVKFKVSNKTAFFAKQGGRVVKIDRPDNADLDGNRYECCIDFRELNGDPAKMEACGYWANGILLKEDSAMFEDLNEQADENDADDVELGF